MEVIRAHLLELAGEVGAQLNVIEDDDERAALQLDYERELNDVLYAGSERRTSRREAGTW
jgi:hypothetical protein